MLRMLSDAPPLPNVLAAGKPHRKQNLHETSTHCSFYWDGQQHFGNSSALTQLSWWADQLMAGYMPASSWVRPGLSPVKWLFSHISALYGRLYRDLLTRKFPPACADHLQSLWTAYITNPSGAKSSSAPPSVHFLPCLLPQPLHMLTIPLQLLQWVEFVCLFWVFECVCVLQCGWGSACAYTCVCFSEKQREDWKEDAFTRFPQLCWQ